MKASDLLTSHGIAGKRYVAALAELQAAFIDLAGHDRALENGHVPSGPDPVRGFFGIPDSVPWALRHMHFAPDVGINWQDAVQARGNELIAAVTSAD
ncbi:hypothetical protein EN814_16365 [Mesorhizobium sp. M2D.F.Ca.ET.171.01.1.1]|uniref:hypothetical protein n=1 Tax=unclassified Mesorhizobium TaxID=325217 RepID=UPI00109282B4|nr:MULTISPECIES: hypothetical protein [unclassified Mesorhizobium]TGS95276.1 hypothetical protein EN821_16380 [Mesorhizobium sp. M2D.F.Ca.ET.178.01.1.1]TGT10815.1 hypothetical protein EN814_16365 [Mesorhizobium sp. M2D.F.Ca.ET.171.01.1.1]